MTRKKAQFGLDTLLSYLLFGIFLVFTMIALTLSGCGSNRHKVERGIGVDDGGLANLMASEQLSAYLATGIPEKDVLYKRVDAAERMFAAGTPFDSRKAKEFLDRHPEVYAGRSYAEFVSAIYDYRDDAAVNDAFDAVTKAVFYRQLYSKSVRDANAGRLDGIYYSPQISVFYGMQGRFYYGSEDLVSSGLRVSGAGANAFRQLPTSDMKGLTVKLESRMEGASQPLP